MLPPVGKPILVTFAIGVVVESPLGVVGQNESDDHGGRIYCAMPGQRELQNVGLTKVGLHGQASLTNLECFLGAVRPRTGVGCCARLGQGTHAPSGVRQG
jgi:hypothetical protein